MSFPPRGACAVTCGMCVCHACTLHSLEQVPPHYCSGEGVPSTAFSTDFWARAHVDSDSPLIGGCFVTFFDGPVSQYFVLPANNIAVELQHQQLVLFDPSVPHCAARPQLDTNAHVYSVVPVCKKGLISATPTNMHQTHAPRLLLPLTPDSCVPNAHATGPAQMAAWLGPEWQSAVEGMPLPEVCGSSHPPHTTCSAADAGATPSEQTPASAPHTLYAIELYADASPMCRFVHAKQIATTVHTLALDWHARPKAPIEPRTGSTHRHQQVNLDQLTYNLLHTITMAAWQVPPEAVHFIHASPNCASQSLASAASQVHRTGDAAPKSEEAHLSDRTLHSTLTMLERLRQSARPSMLITVENPAHSYFSRHVTVKHLLATAPWQLLFSNHCSTATEELDGVVTDDPYSCGLLPEKRTIWLTTGLPSWAQLSTCQNNCRMLVPGEKYHRILICNPAKDPIKQGQRVLRATENKARIPLGAFEELWSLRREMMDYEDGAQQYCITCGSDEQEPTNMLYMCESAACTHVQHRLCYTGGEGRPVPHVFTCTFCELRHACAPVPFKLE